MGKKEPKGEAEWTGERVKMEALSEAYGKRPVKGGRGRG